MAYKLKKVYICDHCKNVSLPDIWFSPSGSYLHMPEGWGLLGKEHLCPECYKAYMRFRYPESKTKFGVDLANGPDIMGRPNSINFDEDKGEN